MDSPAMCGIVGYVGEQPAQDVVIEGLRRLEYRGYDSAGIALVVDGTHRVGKKAGKLANLEKAIAERPLPASTTGIGHTRWATHGAPNDVNAHPHLGFSRPGRTGAQRDHRELRRAARPVEADATSSASETDTEVAAHLLGARARLRGRPDRGDAAGLPPLEGAFTLVAVGRPGPDPGRGRPAQLAAGRRAR